jgi:hypothetical protein
MIIAAATEGWQPAADFLMYCVLACLPWAGEALYERHPDGLTRCDTEYLTIGFCVENTSCDLIS